jgi:hypothetical protein
MRGSNVSGHANNMNGMRFSGMDSDALKCVLCCLDLPIRVALLPACRSVTLDTNPLLQSYSHISYHAVRIVFPCINLNTLYMKNVLNKHF